MRSWKGGNEKGEGGRDDWKKKKKRSCIGSAFFVFFLADRLSAQGRRGFFSSRRQGAVCDASHRVSWSGEAFEGFKAVEFRPLAFERDQAPEGGRRDEKRREREKEKKKRPIARTTN